MLLLIGLEPPPGPQPAPEPGDTTAVTAAAPAGPGEHPAAPRTPAGKVPAPPAPPDADPMAAALLEAMQVGASVYVVAIGTEDSPVPAALRDTAEKSGGQFLLAHGAPALGQALQTVSESLRHRYLLTYMPAQPEHAGWHTIDLKVTVPELVVQAPKTLYLP
jgi:hypothetical protein